MRKVLIILLCSLFLAACGGSAASTTPTPGTLSAPVNAIPTSFSLGKCTDARLPTPDPNEASLFAPIGKNDHILGTTDASVTVLVYSDFQCAACAKLALLLKSLVEKYPQDLRIVFRNFPLESIHDKAAISAQVAEASALPLFSAHAARSVDSEYRLDADLTEEIASDWRELKVTDRMPFRLLLRVQAKAD